VAFVSEKDDLYLVEPKKVAEIIKNTFNDKKLALEKDGKPVDVSLNSVIHEVLNSLNVPKENRGYCLFQLAPHMAMKN